MTCPHGGFEDESDQTFSEMATGLSLAFYTRLKIGFRVQGFGYLHRGYGGYMGLHRDLQG